MGIAGFRSDRNGCFRSIFVDGGTQGKVQLQKRRQSSVQSDDHVTNGSNVW
jgi:hypothetical protein